MQMRCNRCTSNLTSEKGNFIQESALVGGRKAAEEETTKLKISGKAPSHGMEAKVFLFLLLVSWASAETKHGEGNHQTSSGQCDIDPRRCDGIGLNHLALGVTTEYDLKGWWQLRLNTDGIKPQTSRRKVTLEGSVALTRVSECRLKVVLRDTHFNDWENHVTGDIEIFAVVSGGEVRAICGHQGASTDAETTHVQSLARSVVSAVLNVGALDWDFEDVPMLESDHFGKCETQYHLEHLAPTHYTILRTRDLNTCEHSAKAFSRDIVALQRLAEKAAWGCQQTYLGSVPTHVKREVTLQNVSCHQELSVDTAADFVSELQLTFASSGLRARSNDAGLVELNLDSSLKQHARDKQPIDSVRKLLEELCGDLSQSVTAKATLTYPALVASLKDLNKDELMKIFKEVTSGDICQEHPRVRKLYEDALRDSTSPAAAAAKCQLMTSRTVVYKTSWVSSLGHVRMPTEDSLHTCMELLEGPRWQEAVLSVSGMAGRAAMEACAGVRGRRCVLSNTKCPAHDDGCGLAQAVLAIIDQLASRITACSSKESNDIHQTVLAIRGLGNVGVYGRGVSEILRTCGGDATVNTTVRVAALSALGHGPCSSQTTNWLKWEVLNETIGSELRITAFKALRSCNPNKAESVAILITEKDTDTQLKSYVSSFTPGDRKTQQDLRQFSQHLLTNLTAATGIPGTFLESDVVFQSSFLPRSIDFNLTSSWLKFFGGSVQFGSRLENLEDLLQTLFGHDGKAGGTVMDWVVSVLQKAMEVFSSASRDFVEQHQREKRSYKAEDVTALLDKVKQEVITELRGWAYLGFGGQDHFFKSYAIDLLTLEWESLLDQWLDQLLEASYTSLINSNVEVTSGWAAVDESVRSWSLLGTPVVVSQRIGAVVAVGGHSKVDLFSLLTNPNSATLNLALSPSVGMYTVSEFIVATPSGDVVASVSAPKTAGCDVSAVLTFHGGGDNIDLKVDMPETSYHGYTSQITSALHYPPSQNQDNDKDENENREGDALENFVGDFEDDEAEDDDCDESLSQGEDEVRGAARSSRRSFRQRTCNTALDAMLGLRAKTDTRWARGRHVASFLKKSYVHKAEPSITGYKLSFSWKNPGVNSLFLDVHVEAEGASTEKKMGLVFGFTYSPHITLKILLHSQPFTASGEVSIVNDPNLKRLEVHAGYGRTEYGFKAELLMVTDGGQVSVKPRFVIAYPGMQEDALLEGYLARYVSEKVRSLTLDLYTEGTLKQYFDASLKGTVEYRTPAKGDKVLSIKNVHFSTPNFATGLEASFALKEKAVEGRVQVTWGGQVVVLDGSAHDFGSAKNDQHYELNLQMLMPDHPHLDTRIKCVTKVFESEVTNNLTMMVGPEATRRDFQVVHSTSWRLTKPTSPLQSPGHDQDPANSLSHTNEPDHSPNHAYLYSGLAFKVVNKLEITSRAADVMWKFDHTLQATERSFENLLIAKIGNQNHKIMTNMFDQTEDLFKYHAEVEISLPAWHFSYVDTLQQRYEGDVVGQSTTVMPSGRVYSSSSRYFKGKDGDKVVFDFSYDILVRDGLDTWKIAARESFEWTSNLVNLHCGVEVGDITLFGLEMTLDGLSSGEIEFYLKTWTKNVYESELSLNSAGPKTDINFMVLVIPLNREIKSKVALGHDGCTSGTVDGELVWDARGDPTKTLTISSAIKLPDESRTLALNGAMTIFTWTWKTDLQVEFGSEVGDNHRVTFSVTLPDESRLEAGSQLSFSVGRNDLALGTSFDLRLPSGAFHNVSVVVRGHRASHGLSDGMVALNIESPTTNDIHFRLHVKQQTSDDRTDIGVTLTSHSGANYWEPVTGKATWLWDGTRADLVTELSWGGLTVNFDADGSYRIVDEKHQIKGSAELRIPDEVVFPWQQLKATLAGTFIVTDSPSKLEMSHTIIVYKDYGEILNTNGEVTIQVPKVEGRLSLSHTGSVATNHIYTMTGTFTGKELEVDVRGTVDEAPVSISAHYVDGRELTLRGNYRGEDYLSIAFRTELRDISIGIRKGNGTSFSLTSDGQVVYRGSTTNLHHQLSITPTKASSSLKLSPFIGRAFKLTTSRTKYSLNHWGTNVDLSWGMRNFTYRDDVYFRSHRDCTILVEIDAPDLNFDKVTLKLESDLDGTGEQALRGLYLVDNLTLHSAKLTYYRHDEEEERVWQAAVSDLVVNAKSYSDLSIHHALALPGGGLQIKSNLTVDATPVVGVAVTVTPETRALVLSVCSTSEKCVRLQAHAYARSTPSTRTYSVAAQALNSLLWHEVDDPLLQNSVTFTAEETTDKVMITGGILRVQCHSVMCETFEQRGLLHATLHLTPDTLNLLLDTTNRTLQLLTVVKQNVIDQNEITSLPGGRLLSSYSLETQLWLDKSGDPEGMVTWNSTVARYASSRASEWAVRSHLHHSSFDKILRVGGNIVADPVSARAALLLDVFNALEDALRLDLELMHDHGSHVLVANLTKAMGSNPRVIDVVATFLPSPDSAQVQVVMLVPSWSSDSRQHHKAQFDSRFALECGLDTGPRYRHAVAACTLTTPSVREKILLEYHVIGSGGCKGFSTSLGMFNRTYQAEQKSCLSPSNIQASLALKTAGELEDELAFRLGLVDSRRAEMDLLDAIHVKFQLHPPFMLHAMGHSRGTMWSRWRDFKEGIQEEMDDIIFNAKSLTRAMASDLDVMDSLSRVVSPSPAHHLAAHSRHHVTMMVDELRNDQLLKDIAHLAQACVDVTSVMAEAAVAYITHNYGDAIAEVVTGVRVWLEAAVMNMGAFLMQIARAAKDTLATTISFISYLPQRIMDQIMNVPLVSNTVSWVMEHIRVLQNSRAYSVFETLVAKSAEYVHKILSFFYPWNGTPYSSEVAAGVWNIWIPLPECGHSLFDVWHLLTGGARTARHRLSLPAAVQRWWHLVTHPIELFHYVTPPFTGYGAIIGENNFITLDGLTYTLKPSCPHLLVTDSRDGLFALVSNLNETQNKRDYTLFLGDTKLRILPDLQVELDGSRVSLPYTSDVLNVKRDPQLLTVTGRDALGRDLVTLTCWEFYQACIVGVSGWLHADTRGLLGFYDLDSTNELMRPGGRMALSGEVFSESWQVGASCPPDEVSLEVPPNGRAYHLCRKFLLHYGSAAYPCHDYVDVQPFYKTCVSHLSQLQQSSSGRSFGRRTQGRSSRRMPRRVLPRRPHPRAGTSNLSRASEHRVLRPNVISNLLFLHNQGQSEANGAEMQAACNVMAAYSSVCSKNEVNLLPPRPCARKGKLTYEEPLSHPPEMDVVMLVDENTCDEFMYKHLVDPLPSVLKRIAQGKNVSDVKMAILGYGSGGGEVVYYTSGSSFLSTASRLIKSRPKDTHTPRASLLQGLRAISHFPFRPGSARVGLVVRCSDQDLPTFTETLPREMARRRLSLFTLTPDLLLYDPRRPKAVRNTIGVDRWRVYNLRNERQHSEDSWDVRKPDSNVAQLALKSGGGVFTVAPLREESKASYYMKLFRKVLSRAIVKAVNTVYTAQPSSQS